MKKALTATMFIAILAFSTFADGDMGTGTRSCPQGQTCILAGTAPKTDVAEKRTDKTGSKFTEFFGEFFKLLFG